MSHDGHPVAKAAAWAERVRPRWWMTMLVLFVALAVLEHFELGLPWPLRAAIIAGLAFFYVLPLAVVTVRSFRDELREDGDRVA